MSVIVVGLNHRTVPLDLFEKMTVPEAKLPKALADLSSRENISESVILSTCNRIEIYAYAEKFHGAYQDIRNFLSEISHVAPEDFSDHLIGLFGSDAIEHLFKVSSGIDSAVIGEHEILGQVRSAWELAVEEQVVGTVLNSLFRHSLEVGKRARSETSISRNITSVSQAAVAMADKQLDGLIGKRVLVVGAGEMGEGMAKSLHAGGITELRIANRTWDRALETAERLNGKPVRLDELPQNLTEVDLLLTSTGATAAILEYGDLDEAARQRKGRELLIVDIAVPRDVDPAAADLDGVTLLDMDDLREFAEKGIRAREKEVSSVIEIINEELERFLNLFSARSVAPIVTQLHSRAEEIRNSELQKLFRKFPELTPEQLKGIETLTSAIANKLMHEPTVRLKDAAGTPKGERLSEALQDLFDL
ncbi:MAG: glutamyl-tRNA reductase [Acidimicrobiales bacterium]|nr:glutamyl-tRNA reductase [Actinomycetota bacterium]HAQ04660.1 glutamyl-tRNA reductase [Acidimicrobiaceae bacterium]